jgi:hypothetical protein
MPAGSYAFHHGEYGDKFYIIIQGKVSLLEKNDKFEKLKRELETQKHMENYPFGKPKKKVRKQLHNDDD